MNSMASHTNGVHGTALVRGCLSVEDPTEFGNYNAFVHFHLHAVAASEDGDAPTDTSPMNSAPEAEALCEVRTVEAVKAVEELGQVKGAADAREAADARTMQEAKAADWVEAVKEVSPLQEAMGEEETRAEQMHETTAAKHPQAVVEARAVGDAASSVVHQRTRRGKTRASLARRELHSKRRHSKRRHSNRRGRQAVGRERCHAPSRTCRRGPAT